MRYQIDFGNALATAANKGGGTAFPITLYRMSRLPFLVSGNVKPASNPWSLAASR